MKKVSVDRLKANTDQKGNSIGRHNYSCITKRTIGTGCSRKFAGVAFGRLAFPVFFFFTTGMNHRCFLCTIIERRKCGAGKPGQHANHQYGGFEFQ